MFKMMTSLAFLVVWVTSISTVAREASYAQLKNELENELKKVTARTGRWFEDKNVGGQAQVITMFLSCMAPVEHQDSNFEASIEHGYLKKAQLIGNASMGKLKESLDSGKNEQAQGPKAADSVASQVQLNKLYALKVGICFNQVWARFNSITQAKLDVLQKQLDFVATKLEQMGQKEK